MKHSLEIYFVHFSMSLLFVFQHFKNKIQRESGADGPGGRLPPSQVPLPLGSQHNGAVPKSVLYTVNDMNMVYFFSHPFYFS